MSNDSSPMYILVEDRELKKKAANLMKGFAELGTYQESDVICGEIKNTGLNDFMRVFADTNRRFADGKMKLHGTDTRAPVPHN